MTLFCKKQYKPRSILLTFYCLIGLVSLGVAECVNAEIKNNVDFSQRSRYVSIDNDTNPGEAASILLRFSLKTDWNENLGSMFEVDGIKTFLNAEHSDGIHLNGKPLIPDVQGTDVNQAFFFLHNDNLSMKLGRQRINFDTQRFIGGNGFWQNEQTFDALLNRVKLFSNSSLTYAYLWAVNPIFGNDETAHHSGEHSIASMGDRPLNSHLLRVEWNEWDYSQWVAYRYAIEDKDLPNFSNNTTGLSYAFNYKYNALKYHVRLEAAAQKRTEIINAPLLPYYLAELSLTVDTYEFGVSHEILAAKNAIAFVTPLASSHDFQGWANQFTATPKQGITDSSLNIVWRAAPFKIDARYHVFSNYSDNVKVGNELDVDFIIKPAKKHNISLRFAQFTSASPLRSKDVQKIFLIYSYNL